MKEPSTRAILWMIGTFAGLVLSAALAVWIVRPTFDLTYYLPEPVGEQEKVLVERLGQGAGARLLFAEIVVASGDATALAADMKRALSQSMHFLRVENGEFDAGIEAIPDGLWKRRYLMADTDWTSAGLRAALDMRMADLSLMGGPEISRLIAADPTFAAPGILEQLKLGGAEWMPRWNEGAARAFLVMETRARPFDFTGQQAAVAAVRTAHGDAGGKPEGLNLYGVGVYGADIQQTVQRESQWLAIAASAMVLLVVFLAYRSWRLLLISLVPLGCAILGGLLVSTMLFGTIHGITIAFGATLVGVVDDYPMHLFSHSRSGSPREGVRRLFWTLLASAGTAILAYAALAFSGSRGLAQLGVFSLSGVLCAMLATCLLVPRMMGSPPQPDPPPARAQPLKIALSPRVWLPMLVLAGGALLLSGGARWNDNLGELTPLPASLLARDHAMRERFGAPDPRYLVSLQSSSREDVLQQTETLVRDLEQARSRRLVRSWSAVTAVLPSDATQARRRAAIPAAPELSAALSKALSGTAWRLHAFDAFALAAEEARAQPLVRPEQLAGGMLGEFLDGHLTFDGHQWRSVVYVSGLASAAGFSQWLGQQSGHATLVDLKSASESLVREYRERLFGLLGVSLLLIAGVVALATRSLRRILWCAGTVAGAVLVTCAVMTAWQGSLTLFHLISLVLVAGLGVDYCLFYSRPGVSREDLLDSRHALLACAASTAGGFAILSASTIPMLAAIGATVAIGTSTMYVMARFGCKAETA